MKNLALDVKGFDQRFESLEHRTRIAGLGVNVVIAVTVALGSYFAYSVQLGRYERSSAASQKEITKAPQAADARMAEADSKLAAIGGKKAERDRANGALISIWDALDKKKEGDAVSKLIDLDRRSLDPVVRRLADKQLNELRTRAADSAYKNAWNAF
ncbi:MAG: hypothetical protein L3J54_10545, partial [Draconibacterium sp.]|nr:hypothetical protein [Draconibacterium sp.]